jgi:hypothetical protein
LVSHYYAEGEISEQLASGYMSTEEARRQYEALDLQILTTAITWVRDQYSQYVETRWLHANSRMALQMATAIAAQERFSDFPILADALEEAGCTNTDILNHCRGPGEHVRCCWVVDLLLGKS